MEKRMFLNQEGSEQAEKRPEGVGVCVNVRWLLKVMSMGLLVLVSSGVAWGQEGLTREDAERVISEKLKEELNEVKKDLAGLKGRLNEALEEKASDNILTITCTNCGEIVSLYSESDSPEIYRLIQPQSTVKIDTVALKIKSGLIMDMIVSTTDSNETREIFRLNRIASLRYHSMVKPHFNNTKYRWKRLFVFGIKDSRKALKISDILDFIPEVGQFYLPDDTKIKLYKNKKTEILTAGVDLNSNVEFRIYSDILGVFGAENNGLVQLEAKSKIVTPISLIKPNVNSHFFSYVEPSLVYSRFNAKNNSVSIDTTREVNAQEKLDLIQNIYLNAAVKVNPFKTRIGRNFTEFNIGVKYGFVRINAKDNTQTYDANLFSWYFEIKDNVAKSDHFGLNTTAGFLTQTVLRSNQLGVHFPVTWYFMPGVELYHIQHKNPTNKLFIRFRFVGSFDKISQGFLILQAGYTARLSEFGKKIKK